MSECEEFDGADECDNCGNSHFDCDCSEDDFGDPPEIFEDPESGFEGLAWDNGEFYK